MGDIRQALQERILILDGAMGTMLQAAGLQGNNELLNLTSPGIIARIHQEYIEAGADIITANSFGANRISQYELGTADRTSDMAEASARIARSEADKAARKVWVAGSVGPTGKSLSLPQNLDDPAFRPYSFDEMAEAYEEQIRGLISGGADIILLETGFDALNAKAAIYALRNLLGDNDIPIMVSASVSDRSGRLLTGQTIEAFYRSVRHSDPLSFGLNCSLGAADLIPMIAEVSRFAGDTAVSCHPNAGLPDAMGAYSETPEVTAEAIRQMASRGLVNIVGGCCGTTPAHIAAIAEAVKGLPPRAQAEGALAARTSRSARPLPSLGEGVETSSHSLSGELGPSLLRDEGVHVPPCSVPPPETPWGNSDKPLYVSGLESVEIDRGRNFTNVGERTNVAGSRKFARLIAAGDYDAALKVAASQIEGGADIIDINMDDAMLDSAKEMETFLRHIAGEPDVARAAIMIDSSHWETILMGLKNAQGKCIVNSISLKEGEEIFLHKAKEIKALGAAVIVIAFDEEGQATTYDRKIAICRRAYDLLTTKAGYDPTDIIFDVNILPVGTGIPEHERYGIDFIEAVRWIKANLPGCRTSGGVSNLSFAFRGNNPVREAMHSVFLYHAIGAGLDMGIVNPGMLQVYDDIEPDLLRRVEDVILASDPAATDRLLEYITSVPSGSMGAPTASLRSAPPLAPLRSAPVPPLNVPRVAVVGAPILPDGEAKGDEGVHGPGTSEPHVPPRVGSPLEGRIRTDADPEEKIRRALVRGDSDVLEDALNECLEKYGEAYRVIEGPLMDGMARVGELFGAGKMFLPQVVKSAKIMKAAVEILQPHLEAGTKGAADRPKAIFATVKGDVHDIGKNITGIVFTCNGFHVIDLGVMVPGETILERAEAEKADIIGVSGLITPSLHEMEELCKEMASRGMDTPLLVGGAAASAVHTAVKLAPLYDHVFYGPDASASAVLASRLVSDREATESAEHERQSSLRKAYLESREKPVQEIAAGFPRESFMVGNPFPDIAGRTLGVEEVEGYFDWRMFETILGVKPEGNHLEVRKLIAQAKDMVEDMKTSGECRITVSVRFDAAHREGDDIVAPGFSLPMFRTKSGRSLADFVAPKEYGFDSPFGMFAISVSSATGDLIRRAVTLTLAEATSAWLDEYVKQYIPESSGTKVIKPAAGYSSCPDHTLKRDILRLLPGSEKLGITLLDSCAMIPEASICGLIFMHPEATYPEIRRPSRAEVDGYATRRGMSEEEKARFLGHLL